MSNTTKTDIYETKEFFGDYLESTSEKDFFATEFSKRTKDLQIQSLLDLGCFDGSLTQKLVDRLSNSRLMQITAVEPAHAPLHEFKEKFLARNLNISAEFINSSMEDFLETNQRVYDFALASHSLYWIGDTNETVTKVISAGKSGAIIIRDEGILHEVEIKYRPRMTSKKKRFISSREIVDVLSAASIFYEKQNFLASMKVQKFDTPEFMQMAGFLLDLTIEELDKGLLKDLYTDLKVAGGRSAYGIDIIWFGEIVSK